ncbi:aldehyde dehydrogenase family protein [Amycolatopsis pigmentata]|uniref:Aldehyde dehydrogenase family protein n=1 Tax=Amycolatopsis pigmentata TaxID=450801 RepID=A0ABW5FJ11_9PSEU
MTATIRSVSPQRPDDVVIDVSASSAAVVESAVDRARGAQREWARAGAARVVALVAAADAVRKASSELVELVVREVGKPRAEAAAEVARTEAILRYYAQQIYDPEGAVHLASPPRSFALTRRQAHGVAGLVTPWNFPLAIPVWKAAPALAFGNAVVLKPAPAATACALALGELLAAQLPDALLQVLPGDAEAGEALVAQVDVVSFTGSAAVGRAVVRAAAETGVPVQCELGGQNPAIVLDDVDIEAVAQQLARAAFGYAGQKCTATRRVIVVGNAREFTDALVTAVNALPLGDPGAAETVVGPVITASARDRVRDVAASAVRDGGRVLTRRTVPDSAGWYVPPTIVDNVPPGHEMLRDEVFGPICAVIAAPSVTEAVDIANAVPYGLTAGVYTRDLTAVMDVAGRLRAGQVKINAPTTGVDFHLPFGGTKASSYGPREQGKAAADFYTTTQTITVAAP